MNLLKMTGKKYSTNLRIIEITFSGIELFCNIFRLNKEDDYDLHLLTKELEDVSIHELRISFMYFVTLAPFYLLKKHFRRSLIKINGIEYRTPKAITSSRCFNIDFCFLFRNFQLRYNLHLVFFKTPMKS